MPHGALPKGFKDPGAKAEDRGIVRVKSKASVVPRVNSSAPHMIVTAHTPPGELCPGAMVEPHVE